MSQNLTAPPGPLMIFDVWSLNLVYSSTHIPQHHHNKLFRCCIVYVWIVACRWPVFWWFSLNPNQNWNLSFLGICDVVDHPKSTTSTTPGPLIIFGIIEKLGPGTKSKALGQSISLNLVYPHTHHTPHHHHTQTFRTLQRHLELEFGSPQVGKSESSSKSESSVKVQAFHWSIQACPNLNPLPPPPPPHCGQPRKCTQIQVQSWSLGPAEVEVKTLTMVGFSWK